MFKIKFKTLRFFLIAYLTLICQATFVHVFSLGGVVPDFVLLLVIFFSLYNGRKNGMIFGLVSGLGVDILSGGIVGINCFVLGCVGLLTGLLKERVYTNHLLTRILVPLAAGIFSIAVYYLLAVRFYQVPSFSENIPVIAGTLLYTTLCNVFFADILERTVVLKQMTLS
ncbi:MAG: rod shape-determining protein MreD [Candidatus Omnitrophica bacterium]|nr:rod shape-determining protein MreD [Candidatus Omnitrophota bacterium]MCG2704122.1 rod shape-determining protein MreD [Candidatus Omnitrophota bacterium]